LSYVKPLKEGVEQEKDGVEVGPHHSRGCKLAVGGRVRLDHVHRALQWEQERVQAHVNV